jgi:hypothetical protein
MNFVAAHFVVIDGPLHANIFDHITCILSIYDLWGGGISRLAINKTKDEIRCHSNLKMK